MSNNDKFGVLLFENAWSELGKAIEPYVHDGNVGKYIYCRNLVHLGNFIELTITPSQVADRIRDEMKIQIPYNFVKFITFGSEADQKMIGFT